MQESNFKKLICSYFWLPRDFGLILNFGIRPSKRIIFVEVQINGTFDWLVSGVNKNWLGYIVTWNYKHMQSVTFPQWISIPSFCCPSRCSYTSLSIKYLFTFFYSHAHHSNSSLFSVFGDKYSLHFETIRPRKVVWKSRIFGYDPRIYGSSWINWFRLSADVIFCQFFLRARLGRLKKK